ncbi:MAG TPA: hypothetical protein VK463_02565 [Desulfomonilaceae bacterium]|nr:hypothetical protein [Desulfomonilaceae bacterium]
MFPKLRRKSSDTVKLPNQTLLYGIVLAVLGSFVCLGSLTRLYELREYFPLRLPDQVNEFILSYIPFILGTFVTTVAALAGLILGINWTLGGFRHVSRLRLPFSRPGDYYRSESVSFGLREGRLRSYEHAPSVVFYILGKIWSNAAYISEIPGRIVRWNVRFVWKALAIGIVIHFFFKALDLVPPYLASLGLGAGYVIPSPIPFYNLLAVVCGLKLLIAFSLIPLKKPGAAREMDSMIVEGRGHPSVFFAVLEEGSKIFGRKGFSNRISRSKPLVCPDGETLIGTLIESFPEHVRTSSRLAAHLNLFLGSTMILIGFLQLILMQYPSFSVGYEDFFRLYILSIAVDILLNISIILMGKNFLDQARSLMAVYRFRSSLVYVEAKGDFERKLHPELGEIVSADRVFNPLNQCAFNVRYFSAEAISEAITPEGAREMVGLETSARLAKDVGRLKFLPFQIDFVERYPSSWKPEEDPDDPEDQVVTGEPTVALCEDSQTTAVVTQGNCT